MSTNEALKATLSENFRVVEGRISEACERAGRARSEISLIAVSKAASAQAVVAACELGQLDFAENYVKPAQSKKEEVFELLRNNAAGVKFHMIGHLQRNKVGKALEIFETLHSLDSVRLLEALEKALAGGDGRFPCFIEVNVSGEDSKYGVTPEEVQQLVEAGINTRSVEIAGLMTMAPYVADPQEVRPCFARLREIRDNVNSRMGFDALQYLSMGMTNDFEVAIEEGSTHLRVGTALFST